MDSTYNSVSFNRDDYECETAFWADISLFMQILTKNNYDIHFSYEDCGVYTIEYDYQPYLHYGNDRLIWLSEDEYEELIYRRNNELSEN